MSIIEKWKEWTEKWEEIVGQNPREARSGLQLENEFEEISWRIGIVWSATNRFFLSECSLSVFSLLRGNHFRAAFHLSLVNVVNLSRNMSSELPERRQILLLAQPALKTASPLIVSSHLVVSPSLSVLSDIRSPCVIMPVERHWSWLRMSCSTLYGKAWRRMLGIWGDSSLVDGQMV